MKITTLVELANYLELDKSTVSRALGGKPGVSTQTRERVVQTAIVGLSDTHAEQAAIAARERGLAIPRDLSVTGFDDIDKTLVSSLSLTTVRVDLSGLAEGAVDFLLSPVSTASSSRVELRVETELIVRDSSGPPPQVTG